MGRKRGRKTDALTRSVVLVGISAVCLMGTLAGCGGSSKTTAPTTAAPAASRAVVGTSTTIAGSASVSSSTTLAPPTTVAPSAASPAPGSSTTTESPASGSVQNLVASAAVRDELRAAFITYRADAANTPGDTAIPPSAVGGISPGSLFYAFDPSSSTYWARASFYPAVAASQTSATVGFQDGGADAVFTRPAASAWAVKSVGPCYSGLPVGVAETWGLQIPTACSGTTPAAPTSTPPTTVAPTDTAIVVYGDCKTPSVEPSEIVLTCADYGWILQGLHWSSWTASQARAIGTFVYNDCKPDCAEGRHHDVPGTQVTLTDPAHGASGQLVWSRLQQNPEPPGYNSGPLHGAPFPLPLRPI